MVDGSSQHLCQWPIVITTFTQAIRWLSMNRSHISVEMYSASDTHATKEKEMSKYVLDTTMVTIMVGARMKASMATERRVDL